jgi:hypothetical protein
MAVKAPARKDINTSRQPQRRPHTLQSCGSKLLRAFDYALRSCSRIGAQRSVRDYAGNKKAACRILSGKLQDSVAPIFLGLALHCPPVIAWPYGSCRLAQLAQHVGPPPAQSSAPPALPCLSRLRLLWASCKPGRRTPAFSWSKTWKVDKLTSEISSFIESNCRVRRQSIARRTNGCSGRAARQR